MENIKLLFHYLLYSTVLLQDGESLQVDIAPTLAALTGVPVPRWSLGVILQSVLGGVSDTDLLQIVKHNAEHLRGIASVSGLASHQAEQMFLEAGRMVEGKEELWRIREMYRESSQLFQREIASQATKGSFQF